MVRQLHHLLPRTPDLVTLPRIPPPTWLPRVENPARRLLLARIAPIAVPSHRPILQETLPLADSRQYPVAMPAAGGIADGEVVAVAMPSPPGSQTFIHRPKHQWSDNAPLAPRPTGGPA